MVKPIKIGMLGFGTVGSGVARVLRENSYEISRKVCAPIEIKTVLVRNIQKARCWAENIVLTERFEDILDDEEIQIVIEVMGGIHPAREYMLEAMHSHKHVVTANKDVIAEYGREIFGAAEKNGVGFLFEASVGGGIPIITPLKECMTANRITYLMGIVNGTTNYMLTKMSDEGADYDTVLKEAQKKGYAEADPTADVEGLDAARKAAILASVAFNTRVSLSDVSAEGITNLTPEDISYAKKLGYVIKLLAIAKDSPTDGVEVRVHPTLLPNAHPLASVNDVFNAVFLKGNAVGEAMFYGRGAGSMPTASAVVSDIISIARGITAGGVREIGCTCFEHKKFLPVEKTRSAYYMRLIVDDKVGVLGAIAATFGDEDVSLESVIQARNIGNDAELVIITHEVEHEKIKRAEKKLSNLAVVSKISNVIRVEPGKTEI